MKIEITRAISKTYFVFNGGLGRVRPSARHGVPDLLRLATSKIWLASGSSAGLLVLTIFSLLPLPRPPLKTVEIKKAPGRLRSPRLFLFLNDV